MTITRSSMTPEAIEELINQRVAKALAAYKANHAAELAIESQSQNRDDDDNKNIGGNGNGNGRGNGDKNIRGNGNKNEGGNRNGNPNRNDKGVMPVFCEYTYHDFVECQPLNFKGTEGVMVPEEEDQVEKFIRGLLDNIQGNVVATEPTRLQDVVHIANNLMDQKLKEYVVKNAKNKRSVARAYTAGNNEKRGYAGPLPYCNKCKLHHEGPCTMKCGKYNKVGHMTMDYRNVVATTAT
ncbi:hypothetical protein Tco_0778942 [Tanacetum coccineum]